MKNILKYVLLSSLLFSVNHLSAADLIDREDAFIFFANEVKSQIPKTYQYIDLQYKDVKTGTDLEDALQALVYVDAINNSPINISWEENISIAMFEALSKKIFNINITKGDAALDKKNIYTSSDDIKEVSQLIEQQKETKENSVIKINAADLKKQTNLWAKWDILEDVLKTIESQHFDKNTFEENQLIEGAIRGIAESSWDKYTQYFPPVESWEFFESLDGEYEGIGSYVSLPSPGEFIILSPIAGSPAENAGLKGWDRITHVDDREILAENSEKEIISWIKWPAGTQVKLTIQREWSSQAIDIFVTRAKIVITDVEHERLGTDTYYIQIKNFGDHVGKDFELALEEIKKIPNIRKIIFDVRSNPGGYLWEASKVLSYFVEKWEATAVINYWDSKQQYTSFGYDLIDFNNYELIFLQNTGSASASEIFVGTVKDYYPDAVIIGEQSFGKGSVQSLKNYYDGSTLKFTAAKWFTGKTQQWIDWVWITPDVELEFDIERWQKLEKDNQLERAFSY